MNHQQAAALPCDLHTELGALWSADRTVFRLWAPTASVVTLRLFSTGTDDEPDARPLGSRSLVRTEGGVWALTLPGDWNGIYYTYHLLFPDGSCTDLVDPYARAAGANGQRGMVIDLASAAPEGWAQDRRPRIPPHARSVWEGHVADFSASVHSGVPKPLRGKFLAFTLENTTLDGDGVHPTCLGYLKRLGVSHVQLQPIFDFGSVDETRPLGARNYNWGYDPVNYNVPEGSYATDARRGEVRVRECRAMVQALHRAGIGVVMDVVYNHTYQGDSSLERTVPGYWARRDENGRLTNGSGCGCDLASERAMVRRYIVDSVVYWAREYHMDGFRFDLMALEDAETMNAVRAALDALEGGEDILLYGEPWAGGSTRMDPGARPADKGALDVLDPRVGFFCDNTRDAVKGHVFEETAPGYVNGDYQAGYRLLHALGAWQDGWGGFRPRAAGQVVNYVSAHDNLTLWDKLCAVARRPDAYPLPDPDLLAQNRLAAGIVMTVQGMPFFLAGEEFGRTKLGGANTYKGPLSRNALDWRRAYQPGFYELTQFYAGLLALRRAWPCLSGAAGEPAPLIQLLPGWLIGVVAENQSAANHAGELAVYYNPEPTPQTAPLPAGRWRTLCDGVTAGAEPFGPEHTGSLELPPVSITILCAAP